MTVRATAALVLMLLAGLPAGAATPARARDLGIEVGVFATGTLNAITDVAGVRVGQVTLHQGDDVRTGVTAIIPGPGNLYTHPVPGWIHTANGYGKLIGETQVREFGELETPIVLTCTLCVWRAAQGLVEWSYRQPGMGAHTINPVIGETNDGRVNDMWRFPVGPEHVAAALEAATDGPVAEGSVGAGHGTQAFNWKGGIGTSSRRLPPSLGGYTIGVLVQTNFGGMLTINGVPVGQILGQYTFSDVLETDSARDAREDGSIMFVVATDAPLSARNLDRLAQRAILGLARTGSFIHNGSGDYVIAFSTHPALRQPRASTTPVEIPTLVNEAMSPLFAATVEATEEAIYNALFMATTVTSSRGTLEALPQARVLEILDAHGRLTPARPVR